MSAKIITIADTMPVAPSLVDYDGDRRKGGGGDGGLPKDCPVRPLGMSADGKLFFYLDPGGRLQILTQKDHSRLGILALFNERFNILMEYWPRMSKVTDKESGVSEFQVTGWKPERAAEELIAACGRRGTVNPVDKVRGRGAWRSRDGELVLHCGERVLIANRWHRPGDIDGYIYPQNALTPLPSEQFVPGGSQGPAEWVLSLFRTWNWQRPEVDPHLLLGMLGAMKVGGALPWRPVTWITGEFGAGKSTLMSYVAALCGEGGYHRAAEATAAGIWQTVRESTLPVILDEQEPETDTRRSGAMLRLARIASSGDVVYRGGDNHSAIRFVIQCCFLFGSILVPPLTPQDRSRISVLQLDMLQGIKPPDAPAARLKAAGEALTRRLVDGWHRLDDVFGAYRNALIDHGHSSRSADQSGVLLACAHLLLYDDLAPDADSLEWWCEQLPPDRETRRDWQNCIDWLMTQPIEPYRGGGRKTVAQWIEQACSDDQCEPHEANKALGTYGLLIEREIVPGTMEPLHWLYVANTHQGLSQLFHGSHWIGSAGASNPWVQALQRLAESQGVVAFRAWRRFAGYGSRCTRLSATELLRDRGGLDAGSLERAGGTRE
jgi:hypothetical protein